MSHILQHILVLALPGNIKELDVLLSDECKELHTYPSNKTLTSQLKHPGSEETSHSVDTVDEEQNYYSSI